MRAAHWTVDLVVELHTFIGPSSLFGTPRSRMIEQKSCALLNAIAFMLVIQRGEVLGLGSPAVFCPQLFYKKCPY